MDFDNLRKLLRQADDDNSQFNLNQVPSILSNALGNSAPFQLSKVPGVDSTVGDHPTADSIQQDPLGQALLDSAATAGLGGLASSVGKAAAAPADALLGNEVGALKLGNEATPDLNNLGMYSKLRELIKNKMGNSATPEQIQGMVAGGGIKPDEIQYNKLNDILNGQSKVNKDDLLNQLQQNQPQIKELTLQDNNNPKKFQDIVDQLDKSRNAISQKTFDLLDAANMKNMTAKYYDDPDNPSFDFINKNPEIVKLKQETEQLEDQLSQESHRLNNITAKYKQYSTPGGTNYQENLYQLQDPIRQKIYDEQDQLKKIMEARRNWAQDNTDYERPTVSKILDTDPEYNIASERYIDLNGQLIDRLTDKGEPIGDMYKSGHWEPNDILGHTRTQNFVDTDGNKVLHADELQSDWHQQGREWGYQAPPITQLPKGMQLIGEDGDYQLYNGDEYKGTSRPDESKESFINRVLNTNNNSNAVPDAPFKKTWHELLLKRLLGQATDQDADKLTWSTGQQQADRYDLSKQLDRINYTPDNMLSAWDKNDNMIMHEQVPPEKLNDYIGKEGSSKLIQQTPDDNGNRILENADLKVGGEGMKGFYDKMIPDYLRKLGKPYGAEVGESNLIQQPGKVIDSKTGEVLSEPNNADEAKQFMNQYQGKFPYASLEYDEPKTQTVHSITLTPQFKQAIKKGLPFFMAPAAAKLSSDDSED